ncbi:hypothetical protein ACHAWC_001534 [Mediolabrus comicus]
MITSRTNKAVSMMALTYILLVFGSGCQAWTTISNNNSMMRGPRIGSNTQSTQAAVAAAAAPHTTTNNNIINDSNEMKLLLQSALQHARNTDLKYGLCTPESAYAWSIVDELYTSMPEYKAVEDNVRKVFGTK